MSLLAIAAAARVPWFDDASTKARSPPPPTPVADPGVLVTGGLFSMMNGTDDAPWTQNVDPIDFVAQNGRIYANGEPFDA